LLVSEPDPKQAPDASQKSIKNFYKTINLFYKNQDWQTTHKIKK
jgi:hypothetical protein